MFRASLCPSSGEQGQDWLKLHVKMPGCAGCGCVEPWCRQCALFESCCPTAVEVHTAHTTAPHNHSQHNQASSHEVLTSIVLVLLMMGIMMPEICWDLFNSRNIHLIIVASVGSIIHLIK
jgi:hypothetical protein